MNKPSSSPAINKNGLIAKAISLKPTSQRMDSRIVPFLYEKMRFWFNEQNSGDPEKRISGMTWPAPPSPSRPGNEVKRQHHYYPVLSSTPGLNCEPLSLLISLSFHYSMGRLYSGSMSVRFVFHLHNNDGDAPNPCSRVIYRCQRSVISTHSPPVSVP